jgi:DNA-binding transcriptional ArsR family regulator
MKLSDLAKLYSLGRQNLLLSNMAKHDPDLSLIFQALSDPTRRGFLARLGQGAISVSELARPTGLALPTVMRHLGVLEAAALISTEKTGRTRMCRARPETLAATEGWLADQRAVWEARTDRLEAYVATLMKES